MHCFEQLRTLISGHLEDIEHNRWPVIQRRTGYSMELIQETLHELRKLNPKPGADFGEVPAPTVTPDVFIDVVEGGLQGTARGRTHAQPVHQSQLSQNADERRTRPTPRRNGSSARSTPRNG